jgi:hypothetical protein
MVGETAFHVKGKRQDPRTPLIGIDKLGGRRILPETIFEKGDAVSTDALADKIRTWKETKDNRERTAYFFEHLLDWAIEKVKENSPDIRGSSRYRLMISLGGFTPETTVIACRVLQPQKLYVLTSKESEAEINWIDKGLGDSIQHGDFAHDHCESTDPLKIYEKIRDKMKDAGVGRGEGVMDITGGKKVMSASAAFAAWQLGMDICYVDNRSYNPAIRGPDEPGMERVMLLPNPVAVFGEQEKERTDLIFCRGHFRQAAGQYRDLADRIENGSQFVRFKSRLAEMYAAWCDMDIAGVAKALDKVEAQLKTHFVCQEMRPEQIGRLRRQMDFLRDFSREERPPAATLLTFYLLGLHHLENRRFDFSSLFFYRCLEGSLVSFLAGSHPGLKPSRVDYSLLAGNEKELEALRQRYCAISRNLDAERSEDSLPDKLAFINTAILLLALDERLPGQSTPEDDKYLKYLKEIGEARNLSILAHGEKNIPEKDCNKLKNAAERTLDDYLKRHPLPSGLPNSTRDGAKTLAFEKFEADNG